MTFDKFILCDNVKEYLVIGKYQGSIITKLKNNSIIFSDNVEIKSNVPVSSLSISQESEIIINNGLMVGFTRENGRETAYSQKEDFRWKNDIDSIEYCIKIPPHIMEQYDEGQFSDAFPFTLSLLHTAGLYLNDYKYGINHLDFVKGEILKNPVAMVFNGILIADRIVVDHREDVVFYDCLVVGRDESEELNVSYEPIANLNYTNVQYIIILGIEELKL